jgi:hypothetical protein
MTGSLPSALRCYGLYKGPFCIGAVVIGYPMNDAMYSVGCMTNTAASSSAPYQQESSLRDRARQAIATGDQAAPRALLHQLFCINSLSKSQTMGCQLHLPTRLWRRRPLTVMPLRANATSGRSANCMTFLVGWTPCGFTHSQTWTRLSAQPQRWNVRTHRLREPG